MSVAAQAAWEKRVEDALTKVQALNPHPIQEAKTDIYAIRDGRTDELATKRISVRNIDLWALQDFAAMQCGKVAVLTALVKSISHDVFEMRAQIAAQKGMVYRGVHAAGEVYDTGDMVTYAGGIWHCNEITEARPGDGNPAWTLAVKKGRDAKGVTRATA